MAKIVQRAAEFIVVTAACGPKEAFEYMKVSRDFEKELEKDEKLAEYQICKTKEELGLQELHSI